MTGRQDPLTLDDVVRPSADVAGVEERHVEHTRLAIGRVSSGGRPGDGDGQAQLLALVLDADGAIRVEGVVGRDTLARGVEDGQVACDLVPAAQIGRQVEGRVGLGVEAESVFVVLANVLCDTYWDWLTHPKAPRRRLCHWKWLLDEVPWGRQR